MSRSVSIDAMNKISYCLTYHSFLFYISKLLFVTVILYFCIHFHLAPVEGLFFKPKYRANILCICFNFIAVLFLFLSSPWGSVYRFCTVSSFQLLKLENLLRWSFFTLIYSRSANIWNISYILHIIRKVKSETVMLRSFFFPLLRSPR